ncbi:hypothetical protein B0H63DRAFT_523856 [Podospora didyma]|uniref:F-box domain-containing protein n=1 Tax=Podospora didyma TaxID=330526 RepID=A0AAE0NGM7_9PEZI|nr:hypothetical protein B0H63DRAFT_523856 [Podospora didyma]
MALYHGVAENPQNRTADPGIHPVVGAALHNLTYSPLCSLPDHIRLRIMTQAGPVSLFCLRRTSRIFLRLFGDRRFAEFHDKSSPRGEIVHDGAVRNYFRKPP